MSPAHPSDAADRGRRPVLVVGGGPTGLTVANLLGAYGVPVLLIERNPTTSEAAKAISLDDESLRTMQLAGLDGEVTQIVVPGTGTRYFGASGRPLFHARGSGGNALGHPFKNPFAQPEFERVLRLGLERFPHVDARFGTTLTALESQADSVTATVRAPDGRAEQVDAFAVLACDGGRSSVRELLGIRMTGRSSDQIWLVLDTLEDEHDQRFGMHFADPRRPHVIVPGRGGRCRYEFRLTADEGRPGEPPSFELARRLIAPYRDLRPEQVERSVIYGFHALVADRLRSQRCFLLGDAAHMMPPFAGQGLNSGIRDAANLAWKVALLHRGQAGDALLDTYEVERRPHVQAMVDFSVRLGEIVMTTSRSRALLRDTLVRTAMLTRPGRRYLTQMRYRPPNRITGGMTLPSRERASRPLIGSLLPQPRVLLGAEHRNARLDDALGTGFALIGVDVPEADWSAASAAELPIAELCRVDVRLDDRASGNPVGRHSVTDADGALNAYFGPLRDRFVLVRPDRMVAASVAPSEFPKLQAFLAGYLTSPAGTAAPALLPLPADPEGALP